MIDLSWYVDVPFSASNAINLTAGDRGDDRWDIDSILLPDHLVRHTDSMELSIGGRGIQKLGSHALSDLERTRDGMVECLRPYIRRIPVSKMEHHDVRLRLTPGKGEDVESGTVLFRRCLPENREVPIPYVEVVDPDMWRAHPSSRVRVGDGVHALLNAITTNSGMGVQENIYQTDGNVFHVWES